MQSEFCFVWDFPADCYKIRLIKELEIEKRFRKKAGEMLDVVGIDCVVENSTNRINRILTVNDSNGRIYRIYIDDLKSPETYFQLNALRYYNLPCEITDNYRLYPKTISIDIIFLGKRKTYIEITDFITMLENMIQQAKDERK